MSTINDVYNTFDEPVPYKNLLFHPVKMRDIYSFFWYASCFFLEKNSETNPEEAIKTISMTHFQYMLYKTTSENNYIALFVSLLKMVLQKKDLDVKFGVLKNGKPYFMLDNIDAYDSDDFLNIRNIICEQNMLELPDERIQKNVRDALEEARRFKQKLSGNKSVSLEEQIIALSLYSGWDIEKVYDMPRRKFILALRRASHMIMSDIYLNASMSGFVKFKDKSAQKTWLASLDSEDAYSDVKMSTEALQSKASFESAKNK